jgi:hypothetical protein
MFDKIAKNTIYQYVTSNFNLIDVKPGACRYNYKCHMNSVHEALKRNHKKIVMVVYIDNGYSIIHFLNKDKYGKYYDNTLGQWARYYNFYLIKEVDESEFKDINSTFINYRKYLRSILPLYVRVFSNLHN